MQSKQVDASLSMKAGTRVGPVGRCVCVCVTMHVCIYKKVSIELRTQEGVQMDRQVQLGM